MGKCPFWSTKAEKVSCDGDCPMNAIQQVCAFKDVTVGDEFKIKGIVEDDFSFEDSKVFGIENYIVEGIY